MSLFRQLWIAVIIMMLISFAGSFIVSNLSARTYLEAQLTLKNLDNANALALSMGSGDTDPVTLDLYIAAQFNSGHYQRIRFNAPDGTLISEYADESAISEAPALLVNLFPIRAAPGIAHVTGGWNPIGTLAVESHSRFAYTELWRNTRHLFSYFLFSAIGIGLIGSLILHFITRPLHGVVDQAKAIGEQRFVTSREPYTLEFREVVRAMNQLSMKVKDMLAGEARKLNDWRQLMQHDRVTGLLDRSPYIARLHNILLRDDDASTGLLIVIHLKDLAELNRERGHQTMNHLLKAFGEQLQRLASERSFSLAGRLNGSDFVLNIPGLQEPNGSVGRVLDTLRESALPLSAELPLVTAVTPYRPGESVSGLLETLDTVLAETERAESSPVIYLMEETDSPALPHHTDHWQRELEIAISQQQFKLALFPVEDRDGQPLHWEAPVRMIQENNHLLAAGSFLPWVKRLGLSAQLDLLVVDLALEHIATTRQALAVNLSTALLKDPQACRQLFGKLSRQRRHGEKLWLEFTEMGVHRDISRFRQFAEAAKEAGCKIGIEHVGAEVSHIGELHDIGLDYLKLDGSFTQEIHHHSGNQIFVRGLCSMAHTLGVQIIAEGVHTQAEWDTLLALGIDGGTGPFFH